MKNYYKSLAAFQQECPVLLKDAAGFNFKYVELPKMIHTINPLLSKHGLGFTQKLGTNPETGQPCLTTTIFHVASGEYDSDTVDIPLVELKGQNIYQAFGSGTTYFRRYALSSALGIVSDKDTDAYGEEVAPKKENRERLKGLPNITKPKPAPEGESRWSNTMQKMAEGIKKKKDWDKDILPWLQREHPEYAGSNTLTQKRLDEIKNEVYEAAKTK